MDLYRLDNRQGDRVRRRMSPLEFLRDGQDGKRILEKAANLWKDIGTLEFEGTGKGWLCQMPTCVEKSVKNAIQPQLVGKHI